MIEVSDLVKFYGDRKILHGLSFSVGTGRVCGFLGPNGSGKSTTMDILAGLLGPSSGVARVCGFDVVTQTQDVKAHIGYLPDNPPLYKEMYVHEFIDYAARLRGMKSSARKSAVESILEECDVNDVRARLIGNLSKGYRQRVALCAALVHKPSVLVLDEPTEGLDPSQILHIRNLIKKLAHDRTVILSSHILSEVQATCDEVVIIDKGHIKTKYVFDDVSGSEKSYVFKFSGQSENALNWFKQRDYVKTANTLSNRNDLLVKFSKESYTADSSHLAHVTKEVVMNNFPLVGLFEKKDGLEEVFFDVIRAQQNELN